MKKIKFIYYNNKDKIFFWYTIGIFPRDLVDTLDFVGTCTLNFDEIMENRTKFIKKKYLKEDIYTKNILQDRLLYFFCSYR